MFVRGLKNSNRFEDEGKPAWVAMDEEVRNLPELGCSSRNSSLPQSQTLRHDQFITQFSFSAFEHQDQTISPNKGRGTLLDGYTNEGFSNSSASALERRLRAAGSRLLASFLER
jgi:hypothetical protein